jgi:dipeptidyl aminopeptidase/acylaminoacyl peptidase
MPFDVKKLKPKGSPAPIVQGVTASAGNGGAQISFSNTGVLAYISGDIGVPEYPVMTMDRNGVVSTLWDEPGTYACPKLSPDGRHLSLTALRDGNWDVWIYDLERKVATRLTFDDGYDGDQVWSPDGEWVAFTSDRGGNENPYRKRADGSGEAELLAEIDNNFWATSWSPDGKWLFGEVQGDSFDLWAIPTDGSGEPVEYLATEFLERFPAISPDGKWMAYMSDESGREEVYVRPFPAAGGKWQVSDNGGDWPAWSPDGSEIIYRNADGLMSAAVTTENGSFRAGRPQPLAGMGFSKGVVGIAISGSIFADYEIARDGQSFIILQGGEGQSRQNHVTLVTGWFDTLENTLPGS